MEIIRHGDPSRVPSNQNNKKTRCPYCGCEFKYSSSDTYCHHRKGDWDTSREAMAAEHGYPYEITCPECHYWFFVDCLGDSRSQSSFDWDCERAQEKYEASKPRID